MYGEKFVLKTPKKRDHLGNLCLGRRLKLKWTFKKHGVMMCIGFNRVSGRLL
jgi:hypothetical protein